jgi:hypothetical protein
MEKEPPSLRGVLADSNEIGATEFADRFLHPHDVPYDLATLREHIDRSGLRFLGWFEERSWDLGELLGEQPEFPQDPWERFSIVEDLFDRDQYDLYLVRPEFEVKRVEFSPSLPLRLNPQVRFTETTVRGIGNEQSAQLLFEPAKELTLEQGYIARALARRTASLRELLAEWKFEETPQWLESTRILFAQGYLYNP